VEEGAGLESSFANKDYEDAGAKVTNAANIYKSNILLKVVWFDLLLFSLLFDLIIVTLAMVWRIANIQWILSTCFMSVLHCQYNLFFIVVHCLS